MNFQFKYPSYLDPKDGQDQNKLLAALEQHPEDAVWLHNLIMHSGLTIADHDQVVRSADYLLKHASDNETIAWASYLKANVLEYREQYDEAIPLFKKTLELEPDTEQVLASLGNIYLDKKQYDEALKYYLELEVLTRKQAKEDEESFSDHSVLNMLGEAYYMKKDYDNALKYFETSHALNSTHTESLIGAGRVLGSMKRYDEAMDYFKRAEKLDPGDAYIYFYMGQVWNDRHDFYRALHYYTEALKRKSDFHEVYKNIAALQLTEEGDVKEAIANLHQALEVMPDKDKPGNQSLINTYLVLSRLYNIIADFEKAEYYTQKMMEAMGFIDGADDSDDDDDDDGELK